MKKRIILPTVLLTGALAFGALGFTRVNAEDLGSYPPIVKKLAERFNLAPSEVADVFEEIHDERKAEVFAHFADRLDEMVLDGKITAEQKEAILDKHAQMEEKMESLRDVDPKERHDQMRQLHEEFRSWAEEQGIQIPFMAVKVIDGEHGMQFGFESMVNQVKEYL